jgi:hypothetical protein
MATAKVLHPRFREFPVCERVNVRASEVGNLPL